MPIPHSHLDRLLKQFLLAGCLALGPASMSGQAADESAVISLNIILSAHPEAESDYHPAFCSYDISNALPEGWGDGFRAELLDESGQSISTTLQGETLLWTLKSLGKGASQEFTLNLTSKAGRSTASGLHGEELCVLAGGDFRISGEDGGQRLTYHAQPTPLPRAGMDPAFIRGAYIHPLITPGGYRVTEDYPDNHIHHHGVWFPWTKTEFQGRHPDFWNMGQGQGTVAWKGTDRVFSGATASGFEVRHQFIDYTNPEINTVALDESWEVTVYSYEETQGDMDFWMFDLNSTQSCATGDPLILPEYHYGGLGFRGREEWDGKPNAHFLTSYGERDRDKGNFTRGRWVDMSGAAEGQYGGVTVLCHPDNFRAPQPMRLHPTEPFMCYAPSQLGDWKIEPGQNYVSKYRFVVHDGKPDPERLEALWLNYAWPPQCKIK